jgi:hypothetical protein
MAKLREEFLKSSVITPRLQTSLETQAIRERLLSRDDYAFGEFYEIPRSYGERAYDQRILTYLCLFPRMSITRSDFNLTKIATASGLELSMLEPRIVREYNICRHLELMSADEFHTLIKKCHAETVEICKAQSRNLADIVDDLVVFAPEFQDYSADATFESSIRQQCKRHFLVAIQFMAECEWYKEDHSQSPFLLHAGYEIELSEKFHMAPSLIRHPYFESWIDKVDDLFVRLVATVFFSSLQHNALSVGSWWKSSKKPLQIQPEGALKAAQYLVQFKDELRFVPTPRTIAEAIEMGQSKEMVRVRALIEKWLQGAGKQSSSLEQSIRHDIAKASAELQRLKRYKEFQDSPLVFGLRLAAGQIPVISNVVTAIEAAGWIYERWVSKRDCWVAVK